MQRVTLSTDLHGVPGIRAAVVSHDAVVARREEVDNLALALIAPLEADNGCMNCGRGRRTVVRRRRQARSVAARLLGFVRWKSASAARRVRVYAAGFCCCADELPDCDGGAPSTRGIGMRMFEPQPRQRTSLPRALEGTASTRWHPRFGHMIRMTSSPAIGNCLRWWRVDRHRGRNRQVWAPA